MHHFRNFFMHKLLNTMFVSTLEIDFLYMLVHKPFLTHAQFLSFNVWLLSFLNKKWVFL